MRTAIVSFLLLCIVTVTVIPNAIAVPTTDENVEQDTVQLQASFMIIGIVDLRWEDGYGRGPPFIFYGFTPIGALRIGGLQGPCLLGPWYGYISFFDYAVVPKVPIGFGKSNENSGAEAENHSVFTSDLLKNKDARAHLADSMILPLTLFMMYSRVKTILKISSG